MKIIILAVIAACVLPACSGNRNNSSQTHVNELGNLMEQELMKVPEVTGTARRTARGELDEHSQSTNSAELDVQFVLKDRSREEVFDDMRQKLAGVPGIAVTIGQPLGHRIDHMLSGTRANIAIKLFGTDLSNMFMIGNRKDISIKQGLDFPTVYAQRIHLLRNKDHSASSLYRAKRHDILLEAKELLVELIIKRCRRYGRWGCIAGY